MTTMPVFCGRDCGGDACPLLAEVEEGRVLRIRHNPAAGPYIRGCPKGFALPHFHYSPERLKTPLLRVGPRGSGQFRKIAWDEALDRIKDGLSTCRESHGPHSVLSLSSAGSTGALHNTEKLTRRFFNAIGGCTVLDGSYSSNAASFALKKMFGQDYGRSGFDAATMDKSAMIILWGANILEARLGAEMGTRLMEAARRGVPVLSIDPRRTKTAEAVQAEWIPVRPGTDSAFMYAVLHVLLKQNLLDMDYIEARAVGFDEILDYVAGAIDGVEKSPSWAADLCGVNAETIVDLARRWAATRPTMLIPGYSIQRTETGEEAARLCVALQLATGNFALPGGSSGSLNNRMPGVSVGAMDEGDGSGNRHVPVLRWADSILEGQPAYASNVHAIYSAGGNFLNQGADIAKNIKAFESLDFAVCHELFMTPTAAYCDIVLPAASPLQKEDVGVPWAGNYVLYKPQILPYEAEERSDFEIFRELASRFGAERAFTGGRSAEEWIDFFLESSKIPDLETFKRDGIYFGADQERTGLASFASDPAGHALGTASGKIEFGAGKGWIGWRDAGWPDAGSRDAAASPPSWLLVTPKMAGRVHSQGADYPEKILLNTLLMNESDAQGLGLAEGDMAKIISETGETVAAVAVSKTIMRGVVSLPEGTWCIDPWGEKKALGSANHLTSTKGTEESTSCVMHGIRVNIRKVANPVGRERS